ncbi:hypothetical protein JCM10207_005609 [Rhodosporidiobolus poonsookiae]
MQSWTPRAFLPDWALLLLAWLNFSLNYRLLDPSWGLSSLPHLGLTNLLALELWLVFSGPRDKSWLVPAAACCTGLMTVSSLWIRLCTCDMKEPFPVEQAWHQSLGAAVVFGYGAVVLVDLNGFV